MIPYQRYLQLDLPKKQSAFLWGARKTGKSTFLKTAFPNAVYYDLLKSDVLFRLMKSPYIFREEVMALQNKELLIIIDEVQKIPQLLDEVHWLIDNTSFKFILCGSSARKLKRQGVNMLGGRAWKYNFFPLIYPEITDFDLLKVFNNGTIPSHYQAISIKKFLKAYIEDYLTLEIQAEGLVRNLPAFARFLDALRFSHGEMINYTNIARQAGVDAKTIREYFFILIDTLMGYFLYPYQKRLSRDIISITPKFYLFDVGVANALKHHTFHDLKGADAGKALEHYVFLELIAYKHLNDLDFNITYWRTKSGLEVDFILGEGEIAIEVKISTQVHNTELKSIKAFCTEYKPKNSYVVSLELNKRQINLEQGNITILPIQCFLEQLWSHQIIN